MNERIKELAKQARYDSLYEKYYLQEVHKREITPTEYQDIYNKKFSELIVAKVLDEVAERAYYSGDRAWSDELDRRWVELEFGMGELAELKNERS